MSFITYDYVCEQCHNRWDELQRRDSVKEHLNCPLCGGLGVRSASFGGTTRVSVRDGTGRFNDIRTQRKLQKEAKRAARRGDRETAAKVRAEQRKLVKP